MHRAHRDTAVKFAIWLSKSGMQNSDLPYAELYDIFEKEMAKETRTEIHVAVDWYDSAVFIRQGDATHLVDLIGNEMDISPEEIDSGKYPMDWNTYTPEELKNGITIYR